MDRDLILRIPLSSGRDADSWYWLPDPKGLYTVRSCYRMLDQKLSPPSSSVWRKLWQLPVPPKVKNFLWRAMANVLPTADNLRQRRVEWLEELFDRCQLEDYSLAAMICWGLWLNRNNMVWKGVIGRVQQVVNVAGQSLFLWQQACQSDLYSPPKHDSFVHDGGVFIAAKSSSLPGSFDPREAEALAVKEALSWLKTFPFTLVILEMDSLLVFNALHDQLVYPNGFGSIIADCRVLAQSLGEVAFSFVRRSANSAAHTVARVGSSMSGSGVWNFVPPPWLCNSLAV
ncbi:putative reverse transcriptase/RNA-dependent DNA polymerase [Citrus sinensis]|uniref:Reverse transcriptase/RNA-dependent DNA polymerase n=1 Tax=Citrus sinensis TaxID=2711 RepID=A0ACB8KHG4_CITSI|nr:putative reverse transcriptase/RNA-dependent DNA polymerase [Citrus sinensis]